MRKFTQGPWSDHICGEGIYVQMGVAEPGWGLLAKCLGPSRDTQASNAALMAAAPDLLAALEEVVDEWYGNPDCFNILEGTPMGEAVVKVEKLIANFK